ADRPAAVAAGADRHHADRDRSRRTTGRTAGRPFRVPRVAGGVVQIRAGPVHCAELGCGGEADEDRPLVAQARGLGAVGRGNVVLEDARGMRVGPALHLGELLYAHRYPGPRAGVFTSGDRGVDCGCAPACTIEIEITERVELAVVLLDAR